MGGLNNFVWIKKSERHDKFEVYQQLTFIYHFSINLVRFFQHTADLGDNRVQSVAFLDAQKDVF